TGQVGAKHRRQRRGLVRGRGTLGRAAGEEEGEEDRGESDAHGDGQGCPRARKEARRAGARAAVCAPKSPRLPPIRGPEQGRGRPVAVFSVLGLLEEWARACLAKA